MATTRPQRTLEFPNLDFPSSFTGIERCLTPYFALSATKVSIGDITRYMRRLTWTVLWLIGCCSSLSQQSHSLIDGAPIKLSGTLGVERRGNRSFIVIRPGQTYEAVFDSTDRRNVREIGLTMDGQWDKIRALVGQKVSVSGVIQLEPSSPYYLNGTLILAKSIKLPNGLVLAPKAQISRSLPDSLNQFQSLVTFAPHTSERFTYKTWDSAGHLVSNSEVYLNCGLNGPGDVMNCYCPDGFAFTGKGKVVNGRFVKTEPPQDGFNFAQFSIADPVRRSVIEGVECTRLPHR